MKKRSNRQKAFLALMPALVAALVFSMPIESSAQRHKLYTDIGLSLAYFNPGFSATYNYDINRHLGIGAGVQGYTFHTTVTNEAQFTPAAYVDLRLLIRPQHISQYFVTGDFGLNFYQHNDGYWRSGNYVYSVPHNNGGYIGFGFGYLRRITSRGWGAYATLKLISNNYTEDRINLTSGDKKSVTGADATLVISVGFRFGDAAKKAVKKK